MWKHTVGLLPRQKGQLREGERRRGEKKNNETETKRAIKRGGSEGDARKVEAAGERDGDESGEGCSYPGTPDSGKHVLPAC